MSKLRDLLTAIRRNDIEIVQQLLNSVLPEEAIILVNKHIAIKGASPLLVACTNRFIRHETISIEIVNLLLDKGANVNIMSISGNTPLMKAAKYGRLDIVKLLIERGADINKQNNFGYTALMKGAMNRQYDIVDFLLYAGANPNLRTRMGNTYKNMLPQITLVAGEDTFYSENTVFAVPIQPDDNNIYTPANAIVRPLSNVSIL